MFGFQTSSFPIFVEKNIFIQFQHIFFPGPQSYGTKTPTSAFLNNNSQVARGVDETMQVTMRTYPVVHTVQRDSVCFTCLTPPVGVTQKQQESL